MKEDEEVKRGSHCVFTFSNGIKALAMELVFGTENFSKLIMFSHFFVKNTNFALMWVMLNFRRTHYGFKI